MIAAPEESPGSRESPAAADVASPMAPMAPLAVELAHVTARRQGRPVLDDVSLQIRAGEIHLLVGRNGAGKSTLLLALLGQVPFSGDIRLYFQRPQTGRLPLGAAFPSGAIGYVPQTFAADRTLPITVAEFLALSRQRWPVCLGVRPRTRARIAALLARVGLAGFEGRRLGELSGGELRRVLIGNALDPAPELLFCDEPATGLDPEATAELDRTLLALRDAHRTTIVMISHDRAQVRRLADRVSLLHDAVLRTGPAAEVLPPEALAAPDPLAATLGGAP
jgi:zinc transport system ATP-binding protein